MEAIREPPRDERVMELQCYQNNQDLERIVPGKGNVRGKNAMFT